jgi:predicted acyl esterase
MIEGCVAIASSGNFALVTQDFRGRFGSKGFLIIFFF